MEQDPVTSSKRKFIMVKGYKLYTNQFHANGISVKKLAHQLRIETRVRIEALKGDFCNASNNFSSALEMSRLDPPVENVASYVTCESTEQPIEPTDVESNLKSIFGESLIQEPVQCKRKHSYNTQDLIAMFGDDLKDLSPPKSKKNKTRRHSLPVSISMKKIETKRLSEQNLIRPSIVPPVPPPVVHGPLPQQLELFIDFYTEDIPPFVYKTENARVKIHQKTPLCDAIVCLPPKCDVATQVIIKREVPVQQIVDANHNCVIDLTSDEEPIVSVSSAPIDHIAENKQATVITQVSSLPPSMPLLSPALPTEAIQAKAPQMSSLDAQIEQEVAKIHHLPILSNSVLNVLPKTSSTHKKTNPPSKGTKSQNHQISNKMPKKAATNLTRSTVLRHNLVATNQTVPIVNPYLQNLSRLVENGPKKNAVVPAKNPTIPQMRRIDDNTPMFRQLMRRQSTNGGGLVNQGNELTFLLLTNKQFAIKLYYHCRKFIDFRCNTQIFEKNAATYQSPQSLMNDLSKFNRYVVDRTIQLANELLYDLKTFDVSDYNLRVILAEVSLIFGNSGITMEAITVMFQLNLLLSTVKNVTHTPFSYKFCTHILQVFERAKEKFRETPLFNNLQLQTLKEQILIHNEINVTIQKHIEEIKKRREEELIKQIEDMRAKEKLLMQEMQEKVELAKKKAEMEKIEMLRLEEEERRRRQLVKMDKMQTTVNCASFIDSDVPDKNSDAVKAETNANEVIDLTWIDDCSPDKVFDEISDYREFQVKFEVKDEKEKENQPIVDCSSPTDSGMGSPSIPVTNQNDCYMCFCGRTADFTCACNVAVYCSRQCQVDDWEYHKNVCQK